MYFFDQVMGVECLILVGEIGWIYVGGLESIFKVCYGCDLVFGLGLLLGIIFGLVSCQVLNVSMLGIVEVNNVSCYCENDGYIILDVWGYCVCVIWDYNDVFMGVNFKFSVVWLYDVDGYLFGFGVNFEEGCKVVSLGVDVEYQNIYIVSFFYINFFDGKYIIVDDCDFVVFSFGMNF